MARAMRTAAATAALLGLIISAIDEADNEQNDASANEGIDDRAEDSATNQNTDYLQQPSRNDAVHALGRVLTPRSLFAADTLPLRGNPITLSRDTNSSIALRQHFTLAKAV
jgi:hypothetical protein